MTWQTGKLLHNLWCTSSHLYRTIEQNPGSYSSANLGLNHPCSSWCAKERYASSSPLPTITVATPQERHGTNCRWKHRKALYPSSRYLLRFLSHAKSWARKHSCTQQAHGAQTERLIQADSLWSPGSCLHVDLRTALTSWRYIVTATESWTRINRLLLGHSYPLCINKPSNVCKKAGPVPRDTPHVAFNYLFNYPGLRLSYLPSVLC